MPHPRPAARTRGTRRPPSRSEQRLRATALHEAGHAVAAYHLRIRFGHLAIGKATGPELGWLDLWLTPRVSTRDVSDVRTEHAIARSVMVLLAGSQAERMALGRARPLGGSLDFYEAMRCAGDLCRTQQEMSAYLRWMQLRVRALVASPSWRGPIEALAAVLAKRGSLGTREARAIIRRAIAVSSTGPGPRT